MEEKLKQYIDAGFPILYIHTFEEEKADRLILAAARRKTVVEWNGANGLVEFQNKTSLVGELNDVTPKEEIA